MSVKVIYDTSKEITVKWPQMLTTGEKLTVDQAKEIIRRTDDFFSSLSEFSSGNDHNYRE